MTRRAPGGNYPGSPGADWVVLPKRQVLALLHADVQEERAK